MREIRLYFIAAPGRIKIGVTVDVKRRLVEIGKHLADPVELLGHASGSYGFEKHLHSMLAEHALGREWFKDRSEVRSVMKRVLAGEDLGFSAREDKVLPFVPDELTRERWLARFNSFATMIFPDNTTGNLAAFLSIHPSQAAAYLSGEDELPDVLWGAFSAHFVQWVLARHLAHLSSRKSSPATKCETSVSVHGKSRRAF